MHSDNISHWGHSHDFSYGHEKESERRTLWVVGLTAFMMIIEITCGWLFNSMAVLADGWHMGTHTLALAAGVYAYRFARINAQNPVYSFGTGKVHALGSYTSAILLAFVALYIFGQSLWSLYQPKPIQYSEALLVAVVSLIVNLISIKLLHGKGHDHSHDHSHHSEKHAHHEKHDHDSHHEHKDGHEHDQNLKAAYAHVIADAMTSVLAIGALLAGKYLGWRHSDPIVGIIGAMVIAQWAYNLLKNTTNTLLDRQPDPKTANEIRSIIEADGDSKIADLHVWTVAPGRLSAIVSIVAHDVKPIEHYKDKLRDLDLSHITIEVNHCAA